MKAVTHTEVYRTFDGELRSHPMRFWPLVSSGIRTATKKKRALLLLYAVPAISTVVSCFLVYGKYLAESQLDQMPETGGGFKQQIGQMLAKQAMQQLAVSRQILSFHYGMIWFTLLATAWFGSRLFADDRRVGAHQLYFSRPLTRLDYFLGKFFVVAFFAACAQLVPGLIVCLVAAFSSPQWSFVTEQYDVIFETIAYSSVWVVITSLAALAASSLTSRPVFALVGMFAVFALTLPMGVVLSEIISQDFSAVSPVLNAYAFGSWLFGVEIPDGPPLPPVGLAVTCLAGVALLFSGIIWWRLRRIEVVA